MSSAEQLTELADGLYAQAPTAFTGARDAAAKALADKDLARQVKALRKPSVAAWAVNLLVRREAGQIDQVFELAAGLRAAAASLDGDELRTLTRQRRQLTAALTTTARSLARECDVKLTSAVADQVEGMLNAAMLDPVAADVVRSGLVVTAFTSTGLSELDLSAVCAVPEALGHRATPAEEPEPPGPPTLHVVSDEAVRREEAHDRVHQATLARAAAEEEAEQLAARTERLRARRLQLAGEIDELKRRIATIEEESDELDEELEETEAAHEEARGELEDAIRELDAAEAALATFT
jgi:hypothetical protein